MIIQAIDDKVVIRPIDKEKKEGAIAVFEVRKDTLLMGEVVDCAASAQVQVGDVVLFSAYGYEEVEGLIITTRDMLYGRISSIEG